MSWKKPVLNRERWPDQGLVVDGLADVQRQGGEHATGGHALQAIDPDIGNSEGLGVNLGDHQR